ncbi:hypothetical protein, conserved [Leishmania tarentolae]|uniref:CRAL-TRIO domain-containing protein n=1 Tax=Leishmania tarentolae TaxID=5689 RepID=A0A640KQA0_LEITA|nr:hypothetical protein, conserved [Leishmania tarentolae]
MNGTQSSVVEVHGSSYKDTDLLSFTTDGIHLNHKDEHQVTKAIKTLQEILRNSSVKSTTPNTLMNDAMGNVAAMEYLANFSHGMTPGEARYVVYRFLRANAMQISPALEQMMKSAEWRRKHNINNLALFPSMIPMMGFDQRRVCTELRLPLISSMTSKKRYLHAEERLRQETEYLGYCNISYGDPYSNLTPAGGTTYSSQMGSESSNRLSSRPATSAGDVDSSFLHTTPATPANEEVTLKRDSDAELKQTTESDKNFSPKETRRTSGEKKSGGSIWQTLISHIPFLYRQDTGSPSNKSVSYRPSSPNSTSETGRHSRFNSFPSTCSNSGGDSSYAHKYHHEMRKMEEEEKPPNAASAAVPLTATPINLHADSLNFHSVLEPIVRVITNHAPFALHYWDLEGRPVMYCRLGRMHSKKLMGELFMLTPIEEEPRALALLFNTYALLVLEQLIRYCNRQNRGGGDICDGPLPLPNRRNRQHEKGEACPTPSSSGALPQRPLVGSCTIVLDCSGLSIRRYLYKPLLHMVRSIVRKNMIDFPEMVHHIYVTNCTNAMSLSYMMIRGMMTRSMREKVTFCSRSKTSSALCERIHRDLVPQVLGGQCQCPGGCIPSVDPAPGDEQSSVVSHSYGDKPSSCTTQCEDTCMDQVTSRAEEEGIYFPPLHYVAERLVLKARESRKLSFAMDAASEIIWEFSVKHHLDVFFSALFVSACNDGAMLSIVPSRRVQNEAGHYICPSLGTVIFKWSNKHHFFTGCRLSVKVYREERRSASRQAVAHKDAAAQQARLSPTKQR